VVDAEVQLRGGLLYVAPAAGGVGAVATGVVRELAGTGCRVHFVRLQRGGVPALGAFRALIRERKRLRRARAVVVELGLLDLSTFWFALLASLLRRDVVVVAHDAPRIALAPAAGLLGGGNRWRDAVGHGLLAPALDRPLRALLTRRAGAGATLGEEARRAWKATGLARSVVLDHGSDPPAAVTLPPSAGRHVLYAGFIGPRKGLDVLLDAWEDVGPGTDLPLVVVGAGGDSLRERTPPSPHAPVWLGAVDDATFAHLFRTAALVVVPYRDSNPASGIVVRAMVEGRAILATRVPAALDALDDGREGLLVAPGSVSELTDGLRRLLRDPKLRDRLGSSAQARAAARFTWRRHVDGLLHAVELARR
jgi:glycosyltransferase involved in cell wall biosynthesis